MTIFKKIKTGLGRGGLESPTPCMYVKNIYWMTWLQFCLITIEPESYDFNGLMVTGAAE